MSTSQSLKRFADKVVIVTGSSSGIGQDAAVEFAREGASVVIHGQNAERLQKTEQMILDLGVSVDNVLKVLGSMEDQKKAGEIIQKTLDKFGKIDVLVNNAAAATMPGNCNPDVIQLTDLALPHLCKSRGNVVNVSSVVAVRPFPISFYSVMKGGLDAYTKSIAQAYGSRGVRVNSINPGPIDTFIFERAVNTLGMTQEQLDEYMIKNKAHYASQSVLGRMGLTSETSSVIKFLASEEASFMTGSIVLVDGGFAIYNECSPFLEAHKIIDDDEKKCRKSEKCNDTEEQSANCCFKSSN